MAYSEPNSVTSPTPATRRNSSITCVEAILPRSVESSAPDFDVSATIIRKPALACRTVMPWRLTSSGRRASTVLSRFCTSVCAISISVPASKVSVIDAVPLERLEEDM